jgi:ribosomal protein L16 Arg81 hydroxylase
VAMTNFSLSNLLDPIPESDFLAKTFARGFLHIPGPPDKFRALFTWDDLNRILEEHRLQPPLVMLRKDGKDIDPVDYFDYIRTPYENTLPIINAGKLAALVRDGATLSLHEMHWIHRPLSILLGNLGRQFTGPCDVILFASFGSTRAIAPHEDGDDQFILQLAGRKHWQVYGPNEPNPIRKPIWHESTAPKRPPIWEGMLNAGDVLYLPRGWWHEVRSVNEPSLHLTVGLPMNTPIDLIHWALPALAKQDVLRENLPRFGDRAARRAFRERMIAAVAAALHPDILDDYFRGVDADARPAIANPTFPWSAATDGRLPDDPATPVRFTGLGWAESEAMNAFAFQSLGRAWSFPRAAERFLRPLLNGQVLRLGEIRQLAGRDFAPEHLNSAIREAVRGGLLTFG